jgi:hypothetical protein
MAYTLQTSQTALRGGKNILASEHVQFIEVGGTLDASAFGAGTIALGTAVARNTSTGKFEPYAETTAGTFEPGFEDAGILNIDAECNGTDDIIVGEIIVRGSVYQGKLPAVPTDAFKAKNDNIRYVKAY